MVARKAVFVIYIVGCVSLLYDLLTLFSWVGLLSQPSLIRWEAMDEWDYEAREYVSFLTGPSM